MDATRFDGLTSSLTNMPSRRGLLRGLAATLGLAAMSYPGAAAAKKKRKNKNKGDKKKTCKGTTTKCGKKACCQAGQLCLSGTCVTGQGTCPAGADRCSGPLNIPCNDNDLCTCFRSTKGDTHCGFAPDDTTCGDCAADTDCAAFGPGAFCTGIFGDDCCSGDLKGFCVLPCPS
jgi:hypothetical protein